MPAEGGHKMHAPRSTSFAALDAMIRPRSVAVIGASDDATRIGGRPIAYMMNQGFAGAILPVNPNRPTVQGLPAFASVDALTQVPDVAIVAVPGEAAVQAVADLGAKGCRAAIIFTAGFAEVDEAGAAMQERLVAAGRQHGMRILGPNCLGLVQCGGRLLPDVLDILRAGLADPRQYRHRLAIRRLWHASVRDGARARARHHGLRHHRQRERRLARRSDRLDGAGAGSRGDLRLCRGHPRERALHRRARPRAAQPQAGGDDEGRAVGTRRRMRRSRIPPRSPATMR